MSKKFSVLVNTTIDTLKADEYSKNSFEEFENVLFRAGISIQEKTTTNEDSSRNFVFWSFIWDENEVKTKSTRNAGAKKKWIDVTYGDVKKQLEESNVETIAQKYGISRRSMYRKLSDARNFGLRDEDLLF